MQATRTRSPICGRVSRRPFRIHNCIVLWAKKYICFSYKLKTNKLKPKKSEGELHSFISYWTFCEDLVRRYMQISVTRNVYVHTILNSLCTYGRSAKTKRKDKFSGEYVRVHWHLYKLLNSCKFNSSAMVLTFSSQKGRQIVDRDWQCGGPDGRPALRNRKNIYTSEPY